MTSFPPIFFPPTNDADQTRIGGGRAPAAMEDIFLSFAKTRPRGGHFQRGSIFARIASTFGGLELGSRSSGEGGSACNLRTLGVGKVERGSMERS